MPKTLDEARVCHDLSPLLSNDSHCQRVAILSREIGSRMGLDLNKMGILCEAAIHHHSMILQWDQKGLPTFGPTPKMSNFQGNRNDHPVFALEMIEALRVFNGIHQPEPGSQAAITSEILHLANAFDEIYEWRFLDNNPASESIKEIDSLMQSGLWSQRVHEAFHAIFSGNHDRALANAENFPFSIVSAAKKLAFASEGDLTIDSLKQMALADQEISADLMRTVNSVDYDMTNCPGFVCRTSGHIGAISERNLMLKSATRGIFVPSSLHRLWKHSVQCATTMKALARHAGLDPNRAFLLGLLHDIGRMFLIDCLEAATRSGPILIREAEAPAMWTEMAIAGCDHAELGADILAGWNFPESIVESIRNHHGPQLSAEKPTALLYLIECVEGPEEDLASPSRVAEALSKIEMSQERFEQALAGTAPFGKAVRVRLLNVLHLTTCKGVEPTSPSLSASFPRLRRTFNKGPGIAVKPEMAVTCSPEIA